MWIQHSAPISHGSSLEGALISSRGELLGINAWAPVEESQGLYFAVPASTLVRAYSGAAGANGLPEIPRIAAGYRDASPTLGWASSSILSAHTEPLDPGPPHRFGVALEPFAGAPTASCTRDAILTMLVIQGSARRPTVAFIQALPNFLVKQFTTRYQTEAARGGQTSWRAIGFNDRRCSVV